MGIPLVRSQRKSEADLLSMQVGCSQKLETFNAHQKVQKRLRVIAVAFFRLRYVQELLNFPNRNRATHFMTSNQQSLTGRAL